MPTKLAVIALVILGMSFLQVVIDKALGIDFSEVSMTKRIIHGAFQKLTGAAIFAAILFA